MICTKMFPFFIIFYWLICDFLFYRSIKFRFIFALFLSCTSLHLKLTNKFRYCLYFCSTLVQLNLIPSLLKCSKPLTSSEKFVGPVPDPLLNWITELSNVSAEHRWILLRNLKAATVYQFRVSAVNQVGEGSPSEPSNIVELPQEGKSYFFANLAILFSLNVFM